MVYEELRRLASRKLAHERPGQTLQPTALVHEAWLRLAGSTDPGWEGRTHFFAAAAEAMRRILVDNARRKQRLKHGGGSQRIDLETVEPAGPLPDDDLLALDEALMIRTNLLGPEHVLVAASLYHLGGVQLHQFNLTEAADLFRRSLAMRRRLLGNEHLEVAQSLTALSETSSEPAGAGAYAREALAILSRLFPDERASLTVALAQEALARALRGQGKPEEAVNLLRNVVKTRKSLLGGEHPDYANALYNLGNALVGAKELNEAETVTRDALALSRRTVGEQHRHTAFCLERLGEILRKTGRFAEAETAYREALVIWKAGEKHHTPRVRTELIAVLRAQGKLAEAKALLSEATAEARETVETARKLPRRRLAFVPCSG